MGVVRAQIQTVEDIYRLVWTAVANKIPISQLHAKGYASIGCAPCTRAIAPGEAERAGRWWWEEDDKKECGLHLPTRRRALAAGAS